MAPAGLELFKFSLYVFFPVVAMVHFGDPDWYEMYVQPMRAYYTQEDKKQVPAPQTTEELKSELTRLRSERLAKRDSRLQAAGIASTTVSPTSATANVVGGSTGDARPTGSVGVMGELEKLKHDEGRI